MANHEPDRSGLTPWRPGQSGNPKGRPKRPDVDRLDELIADVKAEKGIATVWLAKALGDKANGVKPDFGFFKLLVEYRNGLPPREDRTADPLEDAAASDIETLREHLNKLRDSERVAGDRELLGGKPRKGGRVRGAHGPD